MIQKWLQPDFDEIQKELDHLNLSTCTEIFHQMVGERLLLQSTMKVFQAEKFEGIEGEIARDVERTFPQRPLFSVENCGQWNLMHILVAISNYFPEIGYCQGMNYVAGCLLITQSEEHADRGDADTRTVEPKELAFWILVRIIRHHQMEDMWKPGIPLLRLRVYQFDQLLKKQLPALYFHLRRIGLSSDYFGTQWFMTMFSRALPLKSVIKLWDCFFNDGWKTMFRTALCIMYLVQDELMSLEDLESASNFLRLNPNTLTEKLNAEDLFLHCSRFKVTRTILAGIAKDYEIQVLQVRLQGNALELNIAGILPSDDEPEEKLNRIREDLSVVDLKVSEDSAVFRNKIEMAQKRSSAMASNYYKAGYRLSEASALVKDLEEAKKGILRQFFLKRKGTTKPYQKNAESMEQLQKFFDDAQKNQENVGSKLEAKTMQRYWQKVSKVNKKLDLARRNCTVAQEAHLLAKIEFDETLEYNERCAEQFQQFLEFTEQSKTERMQQLFAEMDAGTLKLK